MPYPFLDTKLERVIGPGCSYQLMGHWLAEEMNMQPQGKATQPQGNALVMAGL